MKRSAKNGVKIILIILAAVLVVYAVCYGISYIELRSLTGNDQVIENNDLTLCEGKYYLEDSEIDCYFQVRDNMISLCGSDEEILKLHNILFPEHPISNADDSMFIDQLTTAKEFHVLTVINKNGEIERDFIGFDIKRNDIGEFVSCKSLDYVGYHTIGFSGRYFILCE